MKNSIRRKIHQGSSFDKWMQLCNFGLASVNIRWDFLLLFPISYSWMDWPIEHLPFSLYIHLISILIHSTSFSFQSSVVQELYKYMNQIDEKGTEVIFCFFREKLTKINQILFEYIRRTNSNSNKGKKLRQMGVYKTPQVLFQCLIGAFASICLLDFVLRKMV